MKLCAFSVHSFFGGAVAVGLMTVSFAPASAQSLGEVARKEAERRKAQRPAEKVYTNKDLPSPIPRSTPSPSPEIVASAPADPVASKTEEEQESRPDQKKDDQKNEAWWRARIAEAKEELHRNEGYAHALQSRINALTRDGVNRDNPVQRARLRDEREQVVTELARVKQEIVRRTAQIAEIEEEARKAGVPPGWLR